MTLGVVDSTNAVMSTDVVSDLITEALVQGVVCLPNVLQTSVKSMSATQKVRRKGALTAEAIAEGAGYTFGANGELTDTSVSLVASKLMVASRLTYEVTRFETGITPERIAQEQGEALARQMDAPLRALTPGLSQVVTSTTVLTVSDLIQAIYIVQSGTFGKGSQRYKAWLDYKAVNEIRKEIVASTASVWVNTSMIGIMGAAEGLNLEMNGYQGTLLGLLDIHITAGLPTTAGDRQGAVYNPQFCFGACVDEVVQPNPTWIHGNAYEEKSSVTLYGATEINDAAGCQVRSDQ